jgi:hypothetical protein
MAKFRLIVHPLPGDEEFVQGLVGRRLFALFAWRRSTAPILERRSRLSYVRPVYVEGLTASPLAS